MAESSARIARPDMHENVRIEAVPCRHKMRVRRWSGASSPMSPVPCLAKQALPLRVGDTSQGAARAMCLGPADWLVVSHRLEATDLREQLEGCAQGGIVVVDVSAGIEVIEVRGRQARELLSKGCGLDLHPTKLPAGQCAGTRLAQLAVVVDCLQEARFELYVGRSYSPYLSAWLLDAAIEFRQ